MHNAHFPRALLPPQAATGRTPILLCHPATIFKDFSHILLNKSLARILISYPGLNEYEIFYLVLINKYGDLKINVFS